MVMNFAHRGSLAEAPENTVASMKRALEHDPKAIELDVQVTKDGHLVVIHDPNFTRYNKEVNDYIKDLTLAEIKQIDVGSSFSEVYAGETVATLKEVLDVIPKEVKVNVEIKNIPVIYEGIEEKVLDLLTEYDRLDNVVISSFDHQALKTIQQLNQDVEIGLLFGHRILEPWNYAKNTGLKLASVHPLYSIVDQEFVDEFHALGLKVYPYTVDEEEDYERLRALGVDGVFSNNPNIFKA